MSFSFDYVTSELVKNKNRWEHEVFLSENELRRFSELNVTIVSSYLDSTLRVPECKYRLRYIAYAVKKRLRPKSCKWI